MTRCCGYSFSLGTVLMKAVFHENGWSSLRATSGSSSVGFLRKPIAPRRSKAAHLTTQMSQEQLRLRFGGQIGHQSASRQKPTLNGVLPAGAIAQSGDLVVHVRSSPGSFEGPNLQRFIHPNAALGLQDGFRIFATADRDLHDRQTHDGQNKSLATSNRCPGLKTGPSPNP